MYNLIEWFKEQRQQRQYQKRIKRIKKELLFFGYNLSGLTDTEIIDRAREAERAISIKRIRGGLLFFGYDLSDLTDEEIEDGVREAGKAIANSSVTVDEAVDSLRGIGKLVQERNES